jgi:hypothetical protein
MSRNPGSLNLLEPVEACKGITLTLTLPIKVIVLYGIFT